MYIVDEQSSSHELFVVMLHGYAMSGADLAPFARSLGLPGRFVFPEATHSLPEGGRAWWPIDALTRQEALRNGARDLWQEHPSMRLAARAHLVDSLHRADFSLRTGPVVLAGFSQGAMLACEAVLHDDVAVDALILLSTSCLALDEWQPLQERMKDLPVLLSHGRSDTDLAFSAGVRMRDWLQEAGGHVTWVPFEGGHEIPLLVWRQVRKFLRSLVNS